MDYFVYVMASQKNGTLYVGVTNNLVRRVYEHKNNLVEGFTKQYDAHAGLVRINPFHRGRHRARKTTQELETRVEARAAGKNKSRLA